MFRENGLVRQHDRYQFELKLGYDLRERPQNDRYRVDTYIFLPENLHVNETTYSKKQFYRDLLLYIRFRTAEFTLESLAEPGNSRSPLERIPKKRDALAAASTAGAEESLDYELRLLGCVFKNALRSHCR